MYVDYKLKITTKHNCISFFFSVFPNLMSCSLSETIRYSVSCFLF